MADIKIIDCNYKEKSSTFRGKHKHNRVELFYIDKGVLNIHSGTEFQARLKQGEICLIPPNHYHRFWSETGKAPNYYDIHFHSKIPDLENIYMVKFALTDREIEIMRSLIRDSKNNTRYTLEIITTLLSLLIYYLLERSNQAIVDKVQKTSINYNLWYSQVEAIKKYISENLDKPVSVIDIARIFHISQSHVSHIFKRVEKCGITEYSQSIRLLRAKDLLRNSSLSITNISNILGFSSIHYFSRWFKKLTGFSPSEYIRSLQ